MVLQWRGSHAGGVGGRRVDRPTLDRTDKTPALVACVGEYSTVTYVFPGEIRWSARMRWTKSQ